MLQTELRTGTFNIRNREAWLLETLLLLYIDVQHLKQDIFPESHHLMLVFLFFLTFQDAVLRQGQLRLRHLSRHKEPGAVQQEGQSSAVLFFSFSPFGVRHLYLWGGGRAPL